MKTFQQSQVPAFQVNPDSDSGFWWQKIEEKNTANNFYILFDPKLQFSLSVCLSNENVPTVPGSNFKWIRIRIQGFDDQKL
jgi:hypothetical protein